MPMLTKFDNLHNTNFNVNKLRMKPNKLLYRVTPSQVIVETVIPYGKKEQSEVQKL